ncbi:hypothetical protein B0H66DRAFT_643511 [Apodospora peruviana]|uniref:Extracellular serine-rich protein n=1 Tax=Apodospora peruviana TaxID=516989 RepID=A0AAE0M066_9PEZI|nr:hypothetical protein B0H66DRAFT_643511 [Apodospora peruviana]
MVSVRRWLCAMSTVIQLASATVTGDFKDTILILARDQESADAASSGLKGYGIYYETVLVPQGGITLPVLNSSATHGNYGGIITVSELSYDYGGGAWHSALTDAQWSTIYAYQVNFGVRLVRIDAWPQSMFGTDTANGDGCCDSGVEQLVKFTDTTYFPTARVKTNAGVSTVGLWHVPAVITNSTLAKQFAAFDAGGPFTTQTTAGVINTFPGGRKQMVWFMSWATSWPLGPNFLQHASIHFLTRGLYSGARKTHLNIQVDDVHLITHIYQQATETFRVRPTDLDAHVSWQADLNTRLPAGSSFFLELAHNGAGDLETASQNDPTGICTPWYYPLTGSPADTAPEFVKPVGTGVDYWLPGFTSYVWTLQCAKLDPLATWFTNPTNRDKFAHLSHTYTHLNLNNATYSDTSKEILFNQQWLAQIGLTAASRYSPHGLVPPAISGLHNGDAIHAFLDKGITNVVGDNTRPLLRNQQSEYWPYITTAAADGYDGLVVVPRWATSIYYNCYSPACTLAEWIAVSGGSGDFANLLKDVKTQNVRNLMSLHGDPFMFHQANLRNIDMPTFTVGPKTMKMSLIQMWVETVAQEMTRLTYWPLVSQKMDDIAKSFTDRMARDQCHPRLKYTISSAGTITGVTATTDSNTCSVPIPVTFPGAAAAAGGGTTVDQVGGEPPIQWTTMSGAAKVFTLGTPLAI